VPVRDASIADHYLTFLLNPLKLNTLFRFQKADQMSLKTSHCPVEVAMAEKAAKLQALTQ